MIIANLYLSMVLQTKVNSYHNYIRTCFADNIMSQMGKVSNKMLLHLCSGRRLSDALCRVAYHSIHPVFLSFFERRIRCAVNTSK